MATPRKEGDTEPIKATLRNKNGRAINVSLATVRLTMKPKIPGIGTTLGPVVCTLTDPVGGKVEYPPLTTDLPTGNNGPTVYRAEWEITFASGVVRTVPTPGYEDFVIEPDLS